ncbi:hypothetical protein COO60DRAFT_1659853 [Scenedesmus sp. NREL 46B-D3]|nr:hypothetical protein COO60DRAFT_1659853 [Scenedesmus sp. NREL 46B-D3]
MQQPHQQLQQWRQQQQRQQAAAAPQHTAQAVAQQSHQQTQQVGRQQLQVQRPVLMPKPADPHSSAPAGAGSGSSSQIEPDSSGFAELREAISAATSLQQLLQLLPAAAVAAEPDLTTRLLLQAVTVLRCSPPAPDSSSSSSSSTPQQINRDARPAAATAAAAASPRAASLQQQQQQQQQQELQQLLRGCDALLYAQADILGFAHASGVLWVWAQLGWRPAPLAQQQQQRQGLGATSRLQPAAAAAGPGGNEQTAAAAAGPGGSEQAGAAAELVAAGDTAARGERGAIASVGAQLCRATTGAAALSIHNHRLWRKLRSMVQGLAPQLDPSEVARCAWGLARSRIAPKSGAYPAFHALLASAQQQGLAGFSHVAALNLIWAVADADAVHLAPPGVLQGLVDQVLGPEYVSWHRLHARQQQQADLVPAAAPEAGSCSSSSSSVPSCRLSPQELACLVWSCANMERDSKRRAVATELKQNLARQRGRRQQQRRRPAAAAAAATTVTADTLRGTTGGGVAEQSQQQQQLLPLHEDALLLSYLAAAASRQLEDLGPRQIATLARGFVLLRPAKPWLVAQLWNRAVQVEPQGTLAGFNLLEVSLLLLSIADAHKQQQQRQQHVRPAVQGSAAAAAAAAAEQVLAEPGIAAVLLHVLAKLGYFAAAAAAAAGNIAAAAAAELVVLAAAAGQLAASGWADSSSSSSDGGAAGLDSPQLAAPARELQQVLRQLALPLAASCRRLMLRQLATALAGYAAAGRRELLDNGSSWALARLLAAYAAAGHTDEALFAAAGVLGARALARFSWALAAAGYHDADVFGAIGVQLVTQQQQQQQGSAAVSGSSSGSAAAAAATSIAWSLGTVGVRDPKPLYALAAAAVRLLPGFSVSQVCSLLWGLAAAGVYHEEFVSAVTRSLAAPVGQQQRPAEQLSPQQVANLTLVAAAAAAAAAAAVTASHNQQQQQQQQCSAGAAAAAAAAAPGAGRAAAVCKKLLAAGARLAVRHTAAVCGSAFGQQVLAALHGSGLAAARPTVREGAAAQAAAAAAAAAAVPASVAATAGGGGVRGGGGGGGAAVWDALGAEVTAQLLGHVVVGVPAAAGGVGVEVGGGSSSSSRRGRAVLLVLVPEAQLSRVGNHSSSSSSSMLDTEQQQQQQQRGAAGMAAVTTALLLPTVGQYRCVVLTEAQWAGWAAEGGGERQALALQQLVAGV